jgi:hypothetical protein
MEKQEFQGDLIHIEPYRIIKESKNDTIDNFFLVLAVVYNDLKGIDLFENLILEKYRSPLFGEKPSAHVGEFSGIFTQTRKIYISYLKEFLDFLKENEKVLLTTEFKNILDKTNKDIKNRWNNIVNIALGNELKEISDFTNYLIKVRNNISFHYYQSSKELRKAFCNFFFKENKIEYNNLAYYAVDDTDIRKTRFFYADAAVQEYLSTANDSLAMGTFNPKYREELSVIINDINLTILRLLKAYLKNRPK